MKLILKTAIKVSKIIVNIDVTQSLVDLIIKTWSQIFGVENSMITEAQKPATSSYTYEILRTKWARYCLYEPSE